MVKQATGSNQPQAGNDEPHSVVTKTLQYTISPGAPLLYLFLTTLHSKGLELKPLAVTLFAITMIWLVRRIRKSEAGERINEEVDDWLLYWYDRMFHRDFSPNQLITWLTKRRFDVSVCCDNVKPRRYRLYGQSREPCRRERCHFGPFRSGELVPNFFKKKVPWRARREKTVFVGPHRLGGKRYKVKGYLLGWTSTGVTFEIPSKTWQSTRRLRPIRCVLLIKLRPLIGFLEYCITIYPWEAIGEKTTKHSKGPRGGVRVFGAFESPYERPKNLPKLCVCTAWEMQGERPPGCTYASHAPVHLL